MSGLLALLDDVAGIAKVAAASVDDVFAQAAKAGSKAAGAVIDDAAVTPKYVAGFKAERELPIIWRIAKGSLRNKLLILVPIGLALSAFAPWLIPPLLMLGGLYLCFEGAEKIAHALGLSHGHTDYQGKENEIEDPAHLEEIKARGAIKTDFILSAEIMTITLAAIPTSSFWMEAATLSVAAILITVFIYGAVALIVKADDFGLALAGRSENAVLRGFGHGLVRFMPYFMKALTIIGTAAMLWVGGSIIVHAWAGMGYPGPEHLIENTAKAITSSGFGIWFFKALIDGILGLAIGAIMIPLGEKLVTPLWRKAAQILPI